MTVTVELGLVHETFGKDDPNGKSRGAGAYLFSNDKDQQVWIPKEMITGTTVKDDGLWLVTMPKKVWAEKQKEWKAIPGAHDGEVPF